MEVTSWQKNKKVERTSPGSKNPYKVTYHDGQEKWTDDLPGDGSGGRREQWKQEHKQSRPSIKEDNAKLTAAKSRYVKGETDEAGLREVVNGVIVHFRERGSEGDDSSVVEGTAGIGWEGKGSGRDHSGTDD